MMNYRTSQSLSALYHYLQDEPCNENLDLSLWLNQGWPQSELKATVMLFRRLNLTSGVTLAELLTAGFSSAWLNKILPLLPPELSPIQIPSKAGSSLNHRYDATLPMMKAIASRGYSLHRLHADSMRVHVNQGSNREHFEWMILKQEGRVIGWVLMPQI